MAAEQGEESKSRAANGARCLGAGQASLEQIILPGALRRVQNASGGSVVTKSAKISRARMGTRPKRHGQRGGGGNRQRAIWG